MNKKKILSILFAGVLCLSPVGVKAAQMYAENEDGTKVYTSIDDAWDAAQNGTKIIMSCDWNLSSRLVLDSDKTATIEMNGHKISRNLTSAKTNGEVIKLCSNSKLNLNGKKAPNTYFSFTGYSNGISTQCATHSGGLITGGYSTNGGGGIHMKSGSKLMLNSVSISGNKSNRSMGSDGHGGAIYMDGEDDVVSLVDSEITFNAAQRDGGAIYIDDKNNHVLLERSEIVNNSAGANLQLDDSTGRGGAIAIYANDANIYMQDNSKIDDNYANSYGGGIYSNGKETQISVKASSISYNRSDNNGGAIYFNYSEFVLTSIGQGAQISHNSAQSDDWGGAIYAARSTFSYNSGKIEGITFDSNSAYIGGALNIHQEGVKVTDCTFTNNSADFAGAIHIANDFFTLENSTIQNNTTKKSTSGAVYVDSYNDISLKGIVNITDNPNSELGTNSDLRLGSIPATDAYILQTPKDPSRIGIFVTENRTLGKKQNENAPNVYFADNSDDYAITYDGSSEQISSTTPTVNEVSASADQDQAEASLSANESEAVVSEEVPTETQNYTITLNMVNEAGTWQNTEKMTLAENSPLELQAPTVEEKEFVEFRDLPETLTAENDEVKADSISSDMEITIVYKDSDSEENTNTASIFGDGNIAIAAVIVVALVALGAFVFIKKKKQA